MARRITTALVYVSGKGGRRTGSLKLLGNSKKWTISEKQKREVDEKRKNGSLLWGGGYSTQTKKAQYANSIPQICGYPTLQKLLTGCSGIETNSSNS